MCIKNYGVKKPYCQQYDALLNFKYAQNDISGC